MNKLKQFFRRFLKEEDGFEFLQVAIIIVIVAGLGVIVYRIAAGVEKNLKTAEEDLNSLKPSTGGDQPG